MKQGDGATRPPLLWRNTMRDIGIGFSYRGIHIDDLKLTLGNNDGTMHALGNDITFDSETVDGFDGAYPTGSTAKPIEFTINMFCEDLNDMDLQRIAECFKRDSYGPLVFDHRPYKYYNARVTSGITPPMFVRFDNDSNCFLYSGTITVKLTAFIPYAYAVDEIVENYPDLGSLLETVNKGSGIIEPAKRPATVLSAPTGTVEFFLLNQGTAPAKCDVLISGSALNAGVIVQNETTGDSFALGAPDADAHTYDVSAFYGRTVEIVNSVPIMADDVKNGGFITLNPAGLTYRGITVMASGSSNMVTVDCETEYPMVGKYLYANDAWHLITGIDDSSLVLSDMLEAGIYTDSVILSLNKMSVGCGAASISAISFEYKDTFY